MDIKECLSKPVTQNKSYTVSGSSHGVLKMTALCINTCCKCSNVLVKTAPDQNQPLFQFINAMDVWKTHSRRLSQSPGNVL